MTQTSRFCEQCGAALNPGARFCGQCGQPVRAPAAQAQPAPAPAAQAQPAPAPAPAPAAAPTEPVLGVIAGLQRHKGLLGYQTWNLVVTPARLVFALMTQQMMNDAVRQAQEQAKREGKGLLARMAAQMGWLQLMVDRYAAMPVDETLAEQTENFFFLPNQIKKVKVEHRVDRGQRTETTDHLIFETTSGKYEFELRGGRPAEARQILEGVLGNKVH
jgi:hypothetical protein